MATGAYSVARGFIKLYKITIFWKDPDPSFGYGRTA